MSGCQQAKRPSGGSNGQITSAAMAPSAHWAGGEAGMTALNGIRVLDLSEGIAPSVAGMLLADFGADVVKVESPGGDRTRRHPGSVAWNRGKRSVTVAKD